jgi:hypothetical protein
MKNLVMITIPKSPFFSSKCEGHFTVPFENIAYYEYHPEIDYYDPISQESEMSISLVRIYLKQASYSQEFVIKDPKEILDFVVNYTNWLDSNAT